MQTELLTHLSPELLAQFIGIMSAAASNAEDAEDYDSRDEALNHVDDATRELIRRVGADEAETLINA